MLKDSACKRVLPAAISGVLIFAGAERAAAAGFRLPDMSIAGLATGNAMVANPDDIGALPYNPAAMAFHKGYQMTAGALFFWTDMEVTNGAGTNGIDVSRPAFAPAGYVSGDINPAWRWGVAFNAPFGLETNWRSGTFPGFAAAGLGALEPSRSNIEMFNINPNVSYLVTAGKPTGIELSLAAGLDYYRVRKAQLDSQGVGLSGDGDGVGWNVAAMSRAGAWSFGISHRSAVGVDIDGDVTAGPFTGPATTAVRFPAMTQAGARWKATDKLALEIDVEYTRWSVFDRIVVNHTNPAVPTPIVTTNDWHNSWTYRLGVTYDLSSATRLRAGYVHDKTPLNDARFGARLPDADRNIVAAGVSQNIWGWTIDLGYSYTRFRTRDYASGVPFGTFGLDANGTNFYNGRYRSHVHVLGLGVTRQFD